MVQATVSLPPASVRSTIRKSDRFIDRYWIGMIESYKARYPTITDLIRRGYSAERIAELAGCEVWVPKMIKYSGRF